MKVREDIDSRIILTFNALNEQQRNEVLNEIVQKMPTGDAINILNRILTLHLASQD